MTAIVSLIFDLPLISGAGRWVFYASIPLLMLAIGVLLGRSDEDEDSPVGPAPSEDQVGTPVARETPTWAKIGCAVIAVALLAALVALVERVVLGE